MNAADALQTFAEISVGVTGFSAVVVAISPNVVVHDERRLHWGLAIIFGWALAGLNLLGRKKEAPLRTSSPMVFAGATYGRDSSLVGGCRSVVSDPRGLSSGHDRHAGAFTLGPDGFLFPERASGG